MLELAWALDTLYVVSNNRFKAAQTGQAETKNYCGLKGRSY